MRRTEIMSLMACVLVACGSSNSVVGGDCAPGYEPVGNKCQPSSSSNHNDGGFVDSDGEAPIDGSKKTDDGSSPPDGGAPNTGPVVQNPDPNGGPICYPPTLDCGGVCIDVSSDPANCGSCGKVCPSNTCIAGQCVGSAPGHVVFVGHDYLTSPLQGSSQSRVLSNATLMPASNPLRVLSYEQYADATAVKNVETLVGNVAKQLGRTVNFIPTTSDAFVANSIDINTYDVLFVHDQRGATSGALATIGAEWQTAGGIDAFLHKGGVVVVLDGGGGIAQMPDLCTTSGLLAVTEQANSSGALSVLAPADSVGSGVVSPYLPKPNTVSIVTDANGGNIVYVVASSGAPVVVHKVVP